MPEQSLSLNEILVRMLEAVKGVLKDRAPGLREHAEEVLKPLAEIFIEIQRKKILHEITEEEAQSLIRMHAEAAKIAAKTVEIQAVSAADEAINAALEAVRQVVNTATGWRLL